MCCPHGQRTCEPSQNGLFLLFPQRQINVRRLVSVCPSGMTMRIRPLMRKGPQVIILASTSGRM